MADRRRTDREAVRHRGASGLGVDSEGHPVIDPTQNVRELFDAGATRQDDLRLAERRLQEEKILRVEGAMRGLKHEVKIRALHQKDLDTLEAKRLDAVRSVDQLAVKTEADRSAAAITALANAAATTAETLRSAVNTSATNLATQLDRTVTAITERIAALEKSSYTGQGKQAVVDPQVTEMLMEMRALRTAQSTGEGRQAVSDPAVAATLAGLGKAIGDLGHQVQANTGNIIASGGKASGMNASWLLLIGGVGLIVSLLSIGAIGVTLVMFLNRAPAPVATPQIYYQPAAPGTLLPAGPPATASPGR